MDQRIQERLNQRLASSSSSKEATSSSFSKPTRARHVDPVLTQQKSSANAVRDRVLKRMLDSISSKSRTTSPTISSSLSSSISSQNNLAMLQEVLALVNEERAKVALAPLSRNTLLDRAAVQYASEMRTQNYFSHYGQDGRAPTDRIKAEGYPDVQPCNCGRRYYYGENIARGQTTAEEVMRDWMNSPGHKANILSKDFREIGLGISGNYWVQEFGGVWDDR